MNEADVAALAHRFARRGSVIAAAGALVLILSFAYAVYRLAGVERRIAELNAEIASKSRHIQELDATRAKLRGELEKFRRLGATMNRAVEQVWGRDYPAALTLLEEVLQVDPTNTSALYWKALSLYRTGRHADAVREANRAVKLDQRFFDPYVVLVFALERLGRSAEAAERLGFALNLRVTNLNHLSFRQADLVDLLSSPVLEATILDHRETLIEIQRRLKALGFYPGTLDGLVGPKTVAAIEAFFDARGIKGELSVPALRALLDKAAN